MLNFIKNISPIEWGVIILILIVLFGRRIVTGFGKAAGETYKEIKGVKKGITDAVEGNDTKSDKKEEV